jgi:hypothetical protein
MKLNVELLLFAVVGFALSSTDATNTAEGILTTTSSSSSSPSLFVPTRISFEQLVNYNHDDDHDDIFWKTLSDVGLISITDVPNLNKNIMLKELQDCLDHRDGNNIVGAPDFIVDDNNNNNNNNNANTNANANDDDGRRRRTLATRTLAGQPEGIFVSTKSKHDDNNNNNININININNNKCIGLQTSAERFRSAVQKVSEAFAVRLEGGIQGTSTNTANPKTVLKNKNTNGGDNNEGLTIERVINEGEHLEHFHSYYSTTTSAASSSTPTIDWHTDQGLVLIFTPGQRDGVTTDGLFIQLKDGSTVEVDFDSNVDDLVIMLGDGVNQYVNPYLSSSSSSSLRAVPHALTITTSTTNNNEESSLASSSSSSSPRLWYGRMVLPPPTAIHPVGNGLTFREMRESMIRGDDSSILQLGCASQHMIARELMRKLDVGDGDGECDDLSMLCWMSCMTFGESDVDPTACEEKGDEYEIECANKDGLIWEEDIHGANMEYYLQCLSTNDTSYAEESSGTTEDSSAAYYGSSVFRVVTVATTTSLVALLCGSIILA